MDALIYMIFALFIVLRALKSEGDTSNIELVETAPESSNRVARINESYYEDPNAFSEIINALGFPKE